MKQESKKFLNKILDSTRHENPRKFHEELQKVMSAGCKRKFDDLSEVGDMTGKTKQEKADMVAGYIEKITCDYPVLSKNAMHELYAGGTLHPLSEIEVAAALTSIKVPRGLHPLDAPRGLLCDAPAVFARPLQIIFNECLRQGDWPRAWKEERTTLIEKKKPVRNLGDYRPIAVTPFFSKCLESIIKRLILEDIGDKLSPRQFGGLKGMSTSHYFADLFQKITDISETRFSSLLLSLDLTKAFNKLLHSKVLQSASELGVRPAVIRLLAGYLYDRRTRVKWGEAVSSERPAKGGCGQGTVLAPLLFIITLNFLIIILQQIVARMEGKADETTPVTEIFAFVDDVSLLLPIDSEKYEDADMDGRVFEDKGRIGSYLKAITDFCKDSGLELNTEKTQAIPFDWSPRPVEYFPGCIVGPDGDVIEVGESLRLLGLQLDRNLSFKSLTKEKRKKGFFALWNLIRLKASGTAASHISTAYTSYVRSAIEYGLTSCYSLLNEDQKKDIEAVQRRATRTILGIRKRYGPEIPSYEERCSLTELDSIENRVEDSEKKFAEKIEFQQWCEKFFVEKAPLNRSVRNTTKRPYYLTKHKTNRRKNSPIYRAITYLNSLSSTPEERRMKNSRNSLAVCTFADCVETMY